MFTGIVQAVGTLRSADDGRYLIACPWPASSLTLGASIACDGCCLTVTSIKEELPGQSAFSVDVSNETLAKTTLGGWHPGRRVNLERALRAGDELGGHLVSGHVDGVATILSVTSDGFSNVFELEAPAQLARFLAPKGSVALDGVSLTVNTVEGARFTVNIIPHTRQVTTFGERKQGDRVNMEVDLIARYVARLLGQ